MFMPFSNSNSQKEMPSVVKKQIKKLRFGFGFGFGKPIQSGIQKYWKYISQNSIVESILKSYRKEKNGNEPKKRLPKSYLDVKHTCLSAQTPYRPTLYIPTCVKRIKLVSCLLEKIQNRSLIQIIIVVNKGEQKLFESKYQDPTINVLEFGQCIGTKRHFIHEHAKRTLGENSAYFEFDDTAGDIYCPKGSGKTESRNFQKTSYDKAIMQIWNSSKVYHKDQFVAVIPTRQNSIRNKQRQYFTFKPLKGIGAHRFLLKSTNLRNEYLPNLFRFEDVYASYRWHDQGVRMLQIKGFNIYREKTNSLCGSTNPDHWLSQLAHNQEAISNTKKCLSVIWSRDKQCLMWNRTRPIKINTKHVELFIDHYA